MELLEKNGYGMERMKELENGQKNGKQWAQGIKAGI